MTLADLEKNIGITFKNKSLLTQAFVHRSHLNEVRHVKHSNERLEFLGDSILSFLTSRYLYETYPENPEGVLTNIRSALVKTTTLADIAKTLHLGELLLLSHGEEASGGRVNQSLLADVFEALLGAIYLDQGIDACQAFLSAHLFPKTEEIVTSKAYVDYKSFLQEVIQQDSRTSPTYDVVKASGPDHDRVFFIQAKVGSRVLGEGSGKSKQAGEQAAALAALEKLGKL